MRGAGTTAHFDHVVDVYACDGGLVERVSQYIAEALAGGGAALVVATAEHRARLAVALESVPISELRRSGRLIELDAAETLASISVAGQPDRDAFHTMLAPVIAELAAHGGPVHVYGEMVALLWASGLVGCAVDLEMLWNELGARQPFSLYCSYPSDEVRDGEHVGNLAAVCGLHSETRGLGTGLTTADGWRDHTLRSFDATLEAPGAARRFVRETLERWGRGASETELGDAELVVAELVSNAVRHARSRHRVELSSGDSGLRIVVEDGDPTLPFAANTSADRPNGRGLTIIAAVCDRWGYQRTDVGKAVWAELGLGTAS